MRDAAARATLPPQSGVDASVLCVAVLGTGSIGMRHLSVLRGIEGVRPLAVPVRPQRVAELSSAGMAAADGLEAAARLGATRCIVATETRRHVEDGLAALAHGMDLLVEKPLGVSAPEAARLRARAREAGRTLAVGCVLRFSESLNWLREELPRLGRLHSVRIECQSHLPAWRAGRPYQESYSARAEDGGVLRDLIHEIDYAGWIFGWPEAVFARVKNIGRLRIDAEELVELSWELEGGALLSLCLDYLSTPPRRRISACGEQGAIEWDGIAGAVTIAHGGEPARERRASQTREAMFHAQAEAFLQAARGLPMGQLAGADDGVNALAVCDAARRSAASRREETVEYP